VEPFQQDCLPTVQVDDVENQDDFIEFNQHLNSIKICHLKHQDGGAQALCIKDASKQSSYVEALSFGC